MKELEIDLTYNPDHFRELYYKNGEGSLFTSQITKHSILVSFFFILATTGLYLVSLRFDRISWLVFLSALIAALLIIYSTVLIIKYLKWKTTIEEYLRKMAKYKSLKVCMTSNALEWRFDSETTIETWDVFRTVYINEEQLCLTNEKGLNYIFPAKSVTNTDFEAIKEFVISKVKY